MLMILIRCFQRGLVIISNLRGQGADGGSPCHLLRPLPVIMLQKVMVSLRTHLVKNREYKSRTNEFQL